MSLDPHIVEGIARVVWTDAQGAWLEPEQTTSCGHCASSAACGSKGIGSISGRLAARRFRIAHPATLRIGDRVVVGIDDRALIKGALAAYLVPLIAAFAAAGVAQGFAGNDALTLACMVAGLFAGMLGARILARRLARLGQLAPRFLRFATPGDACSPQQSAP